MKRQKHFNDEHNVRLAAGLTGYALRIPAEMILSFEQREHRVARARQVTMYLSHVALGMSLARIASAMGRDRSTITHGCHRIEGFRDDPNIDAWLDGMEDRLRSVVEPEGASGPSTLAPIERLQLT